MATMFHLSGNKINFDENFNPGNLSKVKAFLSSNYFLLKISTFFRLHEYLMISPSISKKLEEAEKYINKLDFSQKLNEYEDSNLGRPKFISDIFESLVGAILIDSNLAECFKILNIMLGPFVTYCIKYIGKLKYSPIAELVEKLQEMYKTSPNFTAIKLDEREVSVQVIIDNTVFSKGLGHTEEAAKEAACIKALKKLKNKSK
jgi:dsRNA-specific ribonuclease